ncbi:response regulator [Chryseobacterium wanjuense]
MEKIRILIIEDNDDIRESTAEILGLANYEVFQAFNGKQGIEMAIKYIPDVILCDIMMPEIDGYGVLHLLSKRDDTALIPFIFITAKADRGRDKKRDRNGCRRLSYQTFRRYRTFKCHRKPAEKKERQTKIYSENLTQMTDLFHDSHGLDELKKSFDERKIKLMKKSRSFIMKEIRPMRSI